MLSCLVSLPAIARPAPKANMVAEKYGHLNKSLVRESVQG